MHTTNTSKNRMTLTSSNNYIDISQATVTGKVVTKEISLTKKNLIAKNKSKFSKSLVRDPKQNRKVTRSNLSISHQEKATMEMG